MDNKIIGQFIARKRKDKKLTQQDLADQLGITNKAVSKWETGQGLPDISILPELGRILDTSIDEILNGEEFPDYTTSSVPIPEKSSSWKSRLPKLFIRFRNRRTIICMLLITLSLLLAAAQIAVLLLNRKYGLVSIYDAIPRLLLILTVCSFAGAALLYIKISKKKKLLVMAGVVGSFVLYLIISTFAFQSGDRTFISRAGGLKKPLILKVNLETGEAGIYRQELLLFARHKDTLPYTVDEQQVKLQWLTDDSCTVTWYSPDDNNTHQYVATYGDRSVGPGYYQVASALSESSWSPSSQNSSWRFQDTEDGFLVSNGTSTETFTYSDCVQYGTIALVLCQNGLPRYTIVLNEDCQVDGGVLLEGRSTITLCPISLDKTAPVEFSTYR